MATIADAVLVNIPFPRAHPRRIDCQPELALTFAQCCFSQPLFFSKLLLVESILDRLAEASETIFEQIIRRSLLDTLHRCFFEGACHNNEWHIQIAFLYHL